ncbi:sporulation membrane protein YtrI [Fredinandcohnia sp. 179-A 10B2 NHS]|uniref:sporulation membrane protein YtrI n=1 Tax=Fredinandcohnia sp. 179-A 10B2 NHS TaxID=3235176 RepID=UPI0039A0C668
MRIPPLYEKPGWQRFFAGVAVGALISWFVFLFQFGVLQEKQIQLLTKQQSKINDLEDRNNTLIEDYEKLNEENKSKLKIQDFKVEFANQKKYDLGKLNLHILSDAVMQNLNHLIGKDIESVSKNKELLRQAIEKEYKLDDKVYRLKTYSIYFDTTLEITLNIELVK